MTSRRRYLTFSLRTAFVIMTALAVWLRVVVHRAREQRKAVKAIEALGGSAFYNWEFAVYKGKGALSSPSRPDWPAWLWQNMDDDYFQAVQRCSFQCRNCDQ